jgi:hypothetical protein
MKFKASQKGGRIKRSAEMAIAATIDYGTPVNLDLGDAYADLGAETRDGKKVIVMAVDDGNGFAHLKLSPEQASALSDVLAGLARVGS